MSTAPLIAPSPTAAPLSRTLARVMDPPIMEAKAWVAGRSFPADRPLIDLSQAAPADPPPEALRRAMADAVLSGDVHLYGPVLGDPLLRAEIAARWSADYDGAVAPADVAVTAGCNQAFCAAVATLAGPGDAVLVPAPFYFNHVMWLQMSGIEARPLPVGPDLLPDLDAAEAALADPAVKAVLLVTPNNPTGAEYPAGLVEGMFERAQAAGAALILDETYRDFHAADGPPHGLFARPDWRGTLVHLYSFSKVYRLCGHRTGAMIADPERLALAEKFLDTVAICAPRLGQAAALEGLRTLRPWVAEARAELLARRAAVHAAALEHAPGWRVLGCGAYFAWLAPPGAETSRALARRLVEEAHVLLLPGTIFTPPGDTAGAGALRMAFANLDVAGIHRAFARLGAVAPQARQGEGAP